MDAKMPMMITTISSSNNVNPRCFSIPASSVFLAPRAPFPSIP